MTATKQETDCDYGVDIITGSHLVHFPCKDQRDQGNTVVSFIKNAVGEGGVMADDQVDAQSWVYVYPNQPDRPRTIITPTKKPKVR